MCLPLVKQQSLVGVLYLENNLASHIFTAERLSILRLFASQAAISIENAKLYSEVKAAQEHSRRVNEELRRSFDLIPALAWRASPNGDFEFANQQWHEYTGLTRAEAQGGNWMQAFHPDDLERAKVRWKQLLKAGVAGEFEARMRRFDGDVRRFLVRARPVFDERGHIVNWHGTNTDIETLKQSEQAQEALARATRLTAMGELTVSIVHEISQPLTAISNNAGACVRWLDGDNLDVVRARRAAERIVGDGLRAGQVIAGIRAMAKKAPLEMTAVNLHEIILEVLALTRNQANLYGIVSRTDLSRDTIMVSAVRVQLQQVVLNLVINAIEAMSLPADGQKLLLVSAVRGQGGHAVVTVADTGPGIDPAGADRVFEAFYTTKSEGLGIGLSVCRSIVEAHGGTLWTAPHTPRGTEFSFTVPIGEDVLQTAAPIADLQATVSG
jgi:PAS domain S-box-containing protein